MGMLPSYIGLPTDIQGPTFQLPEYLLDAFTLKGRIAVMQVWLGRKVPNILRWSRAEFDRISTAVAAAVRDKTVIGYGLDYPGLGNLPMRAYDVAEPVFVLENTDEPLQLLGPDDLASEPQARVFIYGAGRGGTLVRTMLESGGRTVAGYVDSARSGSHENLPLIQVDDFLAQRRADDIVIVASQYIQDILPRLAALPPDRVLSAEMYMAHFV